jgi:prepilin peptidase CpaA
MSWDPFLVVIAILLAAAAASDVSRHRIPNELSVAVAASSLVARSIESGIAGGLSALAALALTAAILFPAWARRAIGGGDLKLAAAAAAWVGWGLPGTPSRPRSLQASSRSSAMSRRRDGTPRDASQPAPRRPRRAGIHRHAAGRGRVPLPAGAAFAAGALFCTVGGW